jgi:hypothetical protein
MNPQALNPVCITRKEDEFRAPRLRSIVRKSALLNVAIVLTSAPVLFFAGGEQAVVPTLKIMAGISVLVWASTFAVFSFVSLAWIFWAPAPTAKRHEPPHSADSAGVADRWLDGSV